MQYSHSRVECYDKCPFQFKLRYIDRLTTIPTPAASSPLIVGSALHLGLEKGIEEMKKYYYNQYPLVTDLHINEMIKLVKNKFPENNNYLEMVKKSAFSSKDEIVEDDFILSKNETVSIIPPIGGG